MAELADRRIKASRATLIKALQGDWRPEHLFTLRQARQTYAHYQQLISECDQEITGRIRAFEDPHQPPTATEHPQESAVASPKATPKPPATKGFELGAHLTRLFGTDLTLIPGIGVNTALLLFSELGPDLSRFPSAAQFASWLNLSPQNKITGGKIISSQTGPALIALLRRCAWQPSLSIVARPPSANTSAVCGLASVHQRRSPTPLTKWPASFTTW